MDIGKALTPEQAARRMTATRKQYGVDRIAISGGECTLNGCWQIEYLRLLRELNPGAHLHVDTNGSILTDGYLNELVDAGMTDIGIDLKALRISTFQVGDVSGLWRLERFRPGVDNLSNRMGKNWTDRKGIQPTTKTRSNVNTKARGSPVRAKAIRKMREGYQCWRQKYN